MSEERFDIHQHVTKQILDAIEAGPGEFRMPWHHAAGAIMRPVNVATKKAYQGINVLTLWVAADTAGFQSGIWGTYKQWREAGAHVRKGSKASHSVFYKEITSTSEDEKAEGDSARMVARATPVFAAEQVDGYTIPTLEPKGPVEVAEDIIAVERFIAGVGALIIHAGDRAFYQRSTDIIQLPPREAFRGTATSTAQEAYYATKLHELVHWTGIETRCHRAFGKRFGDQAYAMEELVAELGAAFLCADLGITSTPRADHAQYLATWLAVLKADKKAVFTAASKASQAVSYLGMRQPWPPRPTSATAVPPRGAALIAG